MAPDPLLEPLIRDFVTEADEAVQRITRNLLVLERLKPGAEAPDRAHADVARALHTLKGSAATLGLAELSELAHRMEDAYAPVLAARTAVPAPLADGLLRALDASMDWLRSRAAGRDAPDLAACVREMEGLSGAAAPGAAAAGSSP